MSVETNITHNIALSKDRKIQGIVNIEETGETIDKKDMASITIYIAQKGDILWDIAKRYNTTIDEILSSNNLDTGYEIDVGDKIIIEKKGRFRLLKFKNNGYYDIIHLSQIR